MTCSLLGGQELQPWLRALLEQRTAGTSRGMGGKRWSAQRCQRESESPQRATTLPCAAVASLLAATPNMVEVSRRGGNVGGQQRGVRGEGQGDVLFSLQRQAEWDHK